MSHSAQLFIFHASLPLTLQQLKRTKVDIVVSRTIVKRRDIIIIEDDDVDLLLMT